MQINGNLQFSVLGSGELQNAIIERLSADPTGTAGRLYYNTVIHAYKYFDGTSWVQFAAGTTSVASFSGGTTGLTPSTATTGAITLGGTLIAANGGTGFSSYTAGNLLYADSTSTLAKIAPGTGIQVLHGGAAPSWGSVDLTAEVSNVLPVANGGTGLNSLTLNGVVFGNGTSPASVTVAGSAGNVLVADVAGLPSFTTINLASAAAVGSSVLGSANGGTGVNNGASTLTLGGSLTTAGAFASTFTMTGATNVTFPTSGTLVTTTTAVTSVTGTANQITATGVNAVVLSIPSAFIAPGSVEVTTTLKVDTNTADGFLYSDASKNVVSTGAATNGQLLIGSTGAAPAAAALTASTGISITNGAGSITIANTGVTSVAATSSSAALTVGGSPITTTGTLTFALSAELQGLANVSTVGLLVRDSSGVYSTAAVTGTAGNITVANGDGISANPTVNLASVTQAASGTFSKVTLDGFGRIVGNTPVVTADIVALADTQYLRLDGTTTPSANISLGNFKIINLATPTTGTDATNKNYVDALVTGLEWKAAARAATTVAGTLATSFANASVIDGVTLATGDRVLIKNQATASENGIYIVQASGAPVRSTDAATTSELNNATLFITNGTVNSDTGWTQTTPNPTVGSSNIVFAQFTGAGTYVAGTGLTLTGNTFSANLGAGIASLPSNEIGIDLFNATTGALILTDNGTSRATDSASQLFLLLKSAGGLTQDVNGLYITTAGVTNAMLANPSVPVDVDGVGTTTMTLGTTFNYFGTANRIQTTASANTVTINIDANYAGQATINTLGTVTTGTWNGTTVAANYGGTGFSSYTVGDLLYADSTSTLAKLADVAVGNVLISGGVATAPSWGKVSLTSAVSGILPSANGGTGVNNSFNITLGGAINTAGSFSTSGANSLVLTTTGATNVTLPTSGTLVTTTTAVTTFSGGTTGLTPSSATSGPITLAGTLVVANGGTGLTSVTTHGVVFGNGASAVGVTAAGSQYQVLNAGSGGVPAFDAVHLDQAAAVTGTLPVGSGGTGLTAVGTVGKVIASTGSVNAYTAIQFAYDSTLHGGAATTFTVAHSLNQKFVNVTVYDSTFNQIIPQSVVLTDANTVTITVNSAINVYVVVMGITGVALA